MKKEEVQQIMMEALARNRQEYYTVVLEKGFPIFFKCPFCNNLHSFPDNPQEANFQDPGEASQVFLSFFCILADWEYVESAIFFSKLVNNGR